MEFIIRIEVTKSVSQTYTYIHNKSYSNVEFIIRIEVTKSVSQTYTYIHNKSYSNVEFIIRIEVTKSVPVEMHVFHISSIVLVPWSSCLGGYSSVPDDYPPVLGCEEHVSSLGVFVA